MLQRIGIDVTEVNLIPTFFPENCQQAHRRFQKLSSRNQMVLVGGAWWLWNKGMSVSQHLDWGLEC